MERRSRIEERCEELGIVMTEQRRAVARVLSESDDHPDVETVHQRVQAYEPGTGLATVYRTLHLFAEANVIERIQLRDGRMRYEEQPEEHHDHLVDVRTGVVVEFRNDEIEALQRAVAERLGYRLVDHRLELYCVPIERDPKRSE